MKIPPHKDQVNVSDMHFLKTWAVDLGGAFFKIKDGKIFFLEKGSAKTASGAAMLPVSCIGTEIISYSWSGGKREKYKSAKAAWHDQAKSERTFETAESGTPELSLTKTYASKEEAKKRQNPR